MTAWRMAGSGRARHAWARRGVMAWQGQARPVKARRCGARIVARQCAAVRGMARIKAGQGEDHGWAWQCWAWLGQGEDRG